MTDFSKSLRKASWRGVPFGLEAGSETLGRRKVRHDYPYRDTVWLEDQGKLPRAFRLQGFLVGNSAIYGGGDVKSQLKRLESAAEAKGVGVLVHPSRGHLTVDLIDLVISERWDEGNYYELQFSFVQGGTQLFPAILGALGDLVAKAAGLADAAGLGSFVSAVTGPLQQGIAAATSMAATAQGWIDTATSLARDATSLYGTVSQLGGADFGRFFNGRNAGFLDGLTSVYSGATSIGGLISLGSDLRAAVSTSGAGVLSAIGGLGVTTQATDVGSAIQAHVAALQATAADPADGLRILKALAEGGPSGMDPSTPAGSAMSDLYRRSAVIAMARVSATYQPSSSDDANAVRGLVLGPVDAEINVAGQQQADAVYSALRGLRRTVVDDLADRGGALPQLTQILSARALPAIVLAQRQYGDADRADELVTQADPPHPWFMPQIFSALGS